MGEVKAAAGAQQCKGEQGPPIFFAGEDPAGMAWGGALDPMWLFQDSEKRGLDGIDSEHVEV